jgi:phosphopantetheinyl transferase (holo-ACP synthase)
MNGIGCDILYIPRLVTTLSRVSPARLSKKILSLKEQEFFNQKFKDTKSPIKNGVWPLLDKHDESIVKYFATT